jgi:DNA-binding transcriptional LysR family regulator
MTEIPESPTMDLNTIAAFVAVAEKRSFTAAAAAHGLTASGVSKAISRLEQELHVRLFNRTTRSLSLTADGAVLLERCKHILSDIDDTRRLMLQAQSAPSGRLRVSMPAVFGRKHILPAVAAFMRRYPLVSVEASVTDRIVDMIEEGYDVAVRFGQPPDARIIARPLTQARFVVAASPAYLQQHAPPARLGDLGAHNCIAYLSPMTRKVLEWTFVDDGVTVHHSPVGNLLVDNGEAVVDAAVAGAGLIYCHDYMIERELADGRLRQVLPQLLTPPSPIAVVYPHNRQLSPRVRAFADFLTAHLAPDDGRPRSPGG